MPATDPAQLAVDLRNAGLKRVVVEAVKPRRGFLLRRDDVPVDAATTTTRRTADAAREWVL